MIYPTKKVEVLEDTSIEPFQENFTAVEITEATLNKTNILKVLYIIRYNFKKLLYPKNLPKYLSKIL